MGYLIVLIAALVVGLTGFGFNLVAVPLLTLVMPAKDAVVLALVTGTFINASLTVSSNRAVSWPHLRTILIGSIIGIAFGMFGFINSPDLYLHLLIALSTGFFGARLMFYRSHPRLQLSSTRLVSVGLMSGVLTAMSGMGGPPLAIVLTRSFDDPESVRATIAAHTSVASFLAITGLVLTGSLSLDLVITGLIFTLPGLAGLTLGNLLFQRRKRRYEMIVGPTLLALAAAGLLPSLFG